MKEEKSEVTFRCHKYSETNRVISFQMCCVISLNTPLAQWNRTPCYKALELFPMQSAAVLPPQKTGFTNITEVPKSNLGRYILYLKIGHDHCPQISLSTLLTNLL